METTFFRESIIHLHPSQEATYGGRESNSRSIISVEVEEKGKSSFNNKFSVLITK